MFSLHWVFFRTRTIVPMVKLSYLKTPLDFLRIHSFLSFTHDSMLHLVCMARISRLVFLNLSMVFSIINSLHFYFFDNWKIHEIAIFSTLKCRGLTKCFTKVFTFPLWIQRLSVTRCLGLVTTQTSTF